MQHSNNFLNLKDEIQTQHFAEKFEKRNEVKILTHTKDNFLN